jgi:ABC-2 type transport system permease protein
VTNLLVKLWAFLVRDFRSEVSYRVSFVFQLAGMFFSVAGFYFASKMVNPATEGLDGIAPFPWLMVGLAFQYYFSTALYSFSARIRSEQVIGTLEAMLVSPTPTAIVIFSSALWDFTFGAIRVIVYLLFATLVFGVHLHVESLGTLALGVILTLLSSAGLGILSASFILYFKRGDPINFFLSALTTFFGNVFFPVAQLPESLRWISDFLPISWSLAIVRGALLQGKPFADLQGEVLRLALLTALLLPLGLLFSKIAIQKARREGSLVQY